MIRAHGTLRIKGLASCLVVLLVVPACGSTTKAQTVESATTVTYPRQPASSTTEFAAKVEELLGPYHLGQPQVDCDPGVDPCIYYKNAVQMTFLSHAWHAYRERAGDMGLRSRWKSLKNGDLYEVAASDEGDSVTVQTPTDQDTYMANEPPTSGGKQLFTVAQLLKITQQIADETDSIRATNPND